MHDSHDQVLLEGDAVSNDISNKRDAPADVCPDYLMRLYK